MLSNIRAIFSCGAWSLNPVAGDNESRRGRAVGFSWSGRSQDHGAALRGEVRQAGHRALLRVMAVPVHVRAAADDLDCAARRRDTDVGRQKVFAVAHGLAVEPRVIVPGTLAPLRKVRTRGCGERSRPADSALEDGQVQVSRKAPISAIPVRSPSHGSEGCDCPGGPAVASKVEAMVLQTAGIYALTCWYAPGC
jgi:hypothetical protein